MTSITDLFIEVAKQITETQPQSTFTWDVRGEIPNAEIDENKHLIGVLHLNSQEEIIKGNRTMRLDAAITGQVLIGEHEQQTIKNEVETLEQHVLTFLSQMKYTPILDAVLITASCDCIETGADGVYLTFNLPVEIIAQF